MELLFLTVNILARVKLGLLGSSFEISSGNLSSSECKNYDLGYDTLRLASIVFDLRWNL